MGEYLSRASVRNRLRDHSLDAIGHRLLGLSKRLGRL